LQQSTHKSPSVNPSRRVLSVKILPCLEWVLHSVISKYLGEKEEEKRLKIEFFGILGIWVNISLTKTVIDKFDNERLYMLNLHPIKIKSIALYVLFLIANCLEKTTLCIDQQTDNIIPI
jgi:hypothetical protein